METDLAHSLADKPTSATRDEQSQRQVDPAATARGLTSPARLFSFVSYVLFVVPFIRLVAAHTSLECWLATITGAWGRSDGWNPEENLPETGRTVDVGVGIVDSSRFLLPEYRLASWGESLFVHFPPWCGAAFPISFGDSERVSMGHYTGAKARINRRLGAPVFESAGALRAFEKRDTPPGMHTRRKKPTIYGSALTEKQKIKYYYGLRERQLRKYFTEARRLKGNTGENLLILCERRLDNVIRRAGFTATRPQARQAVVHAHFQLNGRKVNKPSIMLRAGDVITVRNRPNLLAIYKEALAQNDNSECEFVSVDETALKIIVTAVPTFADVSLPVDVGQVVAFLSR